MLPIVPARLGLAESFHACLDVVAREKRYLAQTEAPPLERVRAFVRDNEAGDAVQFFALDGDTVVGWADVSAHWAHAVAHRGSLGMGVHPAWRGRGLGTRLLQACIAKAWDKGLTRIELEARADNRGALALYEKLGFAHEGTFAHALRIDGVYHAAVRMRLLHGDDKAHTTAALEAR